MKKYLLLFFSLIFFNCEYTPTGTNHKNIEKSDPVVGINLSSSPDYIEIYGYVDFSFDINITKGRRLYGIAFFLDTLQIFHTYNLNDSFRFYSNYYDNGEHLLKMEMITTSGNNSLADLAELEQYLITKTWTINISNVLPDSQEIVSVTEFENSVKVKWNQYNHSNFEKYTLKRFNDTQSIYLHQDMSIEIFDNTITELVDSTYLGGPTIYRLDISTANGDVRGKQFHYTGKSLSELTVEPYNKFDTKLTWQPNQYPGSFAYYKILKFDEYDKTNYDDIYIYNVDSCVYIDTVVSFGPSYEYRLETHSREMNGNRTYVRDMDTIRLGDEQFYYSYMDYSLVHNSIYYVTYNPYRLIRLDENTLNELATYILPYDNYHKFDISENGTYCYAIRHSDIYKLDPLSLTHQSTYHTGTITEKESAHSMSASFNVANNNRVQYHSIIQTHTPPFHYIYEGPVVLDLTNQLRIGKAINSQTSGLTYFSKNGDYLINADKYFKVENDTCILLTNLVNLAFPSLFWDYQNIVVECDGTTMNLRNLADLSIISSYPMEEPLFRMQIDPKTNYLMGWSEPNFNYGSIYIYDLTDGHRVHKIDIRDNHGFSARLFNNILFGPHGTYLRL